MKMDVTFTITEGTDQEEHNVHFLIKGIGKVEVVLHHPLAVDYVAEGDKEMLPWIVVLYDDRGAEDKVEAFSTRADALASALDIVQKETY